MPRQRSVRLAALGASAQRTASPSYSARANAALRRRLVVVGLCAASLAMITGYFRESDAGALHDVQSGAARALAPFQIGAERLARPFRDAWGWFDGLRDAKSENERLREQLATYREKLVEARSNSPRVAEVTPVRAAPAPALKDYSPLAADVILDLDAYEQQVVVSAGARDGVHQYDPVVTTRGKVLIGHVSKVASDASLVTLISDRESAVSAFVLEHEAKGILHGRGPQYPTLSLDRVPKREVVRLGDDVVTAGRLSGRNFESFYPSGLAIGRVTAVFTSDTDAFKVIHVSPFATLADLERVVVLRRQRPLPTLP